MKQTIIIGNKIFKNAHDIKKNINIYNESVLYFKNYIINVETEEFEFNSYLIRMDKQKLDKIDIDNKTIEIKKEDIIYSSNNSWTKKIPSPIKQKRVRVTKKIAQERMDQLIGKDKFEIIEWKNTSSPVVIKCLKCGNKTKFKIGSTIYTESNNYGGFEGECYHCINLVYKKQKEEKERIKNEEENKIKKIEFQGLIEGTNSRKCSKCGTLKFFHEFYKNKNGKYGISSSCRKCEQEKRIKQKEKIEREYQESKRKLGV